MTNFATNLAPTTASNAAIQAWAQFIENTLVATGGWVVTGDTGQTLPSALVATTTTFQQQGYRIYRMNDALQATFPIFIKLAFGCNGTFCPGVWIDVGTGSNGSGTITGMMFNGTALSASQTSTQSQTTPQTNNNYGSANTNRFTFCLFVQSVTNYHIFIGLERTKDSTGADTGTGILLTYGGANGDNINNELRNRYLVSAGGTQASVEVGASVALSGNNPSQTFTPGDVGLGILIHFRGVAQQPGTNWFITNTSDVSVEGLVSLTLYGATRTYRQLNALTAKYALRGSTSGIGLSTTRYLMRYD